MVERNHYSRLRDQEIKVANLRKKISDINNTDELGYGIFTKILNEYIKELNELLKLER